MVKVVTGCIAIKHRLFSHIRQMALMYPHLIQGISGLHKSDPPNDISVDSAGFKGIMIVIQHTGCGSVVSRTNEVAQR